MITTLDFLHCMVHFHRAMLQQSLPSSKSYDWHYDRLLMWEKEYEIAKKVLS